MGNGLFGVDRTVGSVTDIVSLFLICDSSFDVISKPYGGDLSAEGACDPGGGGGNKFELLDITEE